MDASNALNAIQQHNLDIALILAGQGVFVFPCIGKGPERKRPCPGMAWRSASTVDAKIIEAWWRRWPDAVPAIDLGRSGLIAVDCDCKLSDGKAWLRKLIDQELLDETPGADTPSGGRHYVFLNPEGLGNSRGGLPDKSIADIDIRGKGGYIIAPGARFTDGSDGAKDGRYVGYGSLAEAADMPAALAAILREKGATPLPPVGGSCPSPISKPNPTITPPPSPPARPSARTSRVAGGGVYVPGEPISDYQREAYGLQAMEGAAAELAAALPGSRNETANAKAYHLGRLVGAGYLTQEAAYGALEQAGFALGLNLRDKLFGPKGTLWRAIQAGIAEPYDPLLGREQPGVVINLATRAPWMAAPDLEPEPEEPPPPPPPSIADIAPLAFGRPDGLLGEMTDWILATSRRPNLPLAIAAATATLSAVCGRHLYGPTGTALNLYIILLAGTGVGKDRPLTAPRAMLRAAGLEGLAQTAKAFSVSAFEQMIVEHPCCCASIDEIGLTLLRRIFHRRAMAHESDIKGVLLTLWGRSQKAEPFATTRRAKQEGVKGHTTIDVPSPSLTLLGASTFEAFYAVLSSGSALDGFLNRFLLCHAGGRGAVQEVSKDAFEVPVSIVEGLQALVPRIPGTPKQGGGNIAAAKGVYDISAPLDAVELRVPWANDAMKAIAMAFEEEVLNLIDANPAEGTLLNRVFETTVRLATLHAVSRAGLRTRAAVDQADWAWGKAWATTSARGMVADAGRHMSDTEAQEITRTVKRVLENKGRTSRSALLKAIDYKYKMRDLTEALGQMIGAGAVKVEQTKTTGRPGLWYSWVGK